MEKQSSIYNELKTFHFKNIFYKGFTLAIVCLLLSSLLSSYTVNAMTPVEIANQEGYGIEDKYEPQGTIVIAEKNGQLLYGQDVDKKWPPASMSKLMTLYLVMEAIDEGKFDYKTKVKVTNKYYDISKLPMLSNNNFRKGAVYNVDELLQIMLTASSNAATFMLANLVDKDDSNFVDAMNQKAHELGMKNTRFYNPAGPPNNLLLEYKPKRYQEDDDNISTARDYAILCQRLVSEYPQILKYTKKVNVTVKKGTQDEETFGTYNHSLEGAKLGYKGVDGLKTGSSDTAGFNTAITGKKKDLRIIQVMMGVEDWYDPPAEFNRNKMANAIMDLIYSKYSYKKVLSKGVHKINDTEIYVHDDLYDVVRKGTDGKLVYKDGEVHYEYKRSFVSAAYKPSTVKYEKYSDYKYRKFMEKYGTLIITLMALSLLTGILLLIYYFKPQWFRVMKDSVRKNKK